MGVLDDIKGVIQIIQKFDNVELMQKVLDFQTKVITLVEENRELQRQLEVSGELSFQSNAYWRNVDRNERDGPFCSRCWDVDKKLVRLTKSKMMKPKCPNCKNSYEI